MTVYTRAEWGARKPLPGPGPLDARKVRGLVFHWPAITKPIPRSVDAVMAALRGWQAYHMDDRGWSDIAYQVAVDQMGNRYLLRGLDRQSAANGDQDVNDELGAVLLILAPGEQPTRQMMREARRVVADHRELFPGSLVNVGHNDVRPEATACPGPIVIRLLDERAFEPGPTPAELLRADLRAAIQATKAAAARAGSPRRPRVLHHTRKALEALRRARDVGR